MKISIIVPVYNVEEYLERCLNSLVNQTYSDVEIIVVDDGSTDKSDSICSNYARADLRIKHLSKKNGGVSSARNLGLEEATGDYVMFVDSDDWIELDTCETIAGKVHDYKYDVLMFSYFKNYENAQIEKPIIQTSREVVSFDSTQVRESVFRRSVGLYREELRHPEHMDSIIPAWMKAYRADIIKGHQFIDTSIVGSEDTLWSVEVFVKCEMILYINRCLYHYWKENPGSITTNINSGIKDKYFELHKRIRKVLRKNDLDHGVYIEAFYNRVSLSIIGIGIGIARSNMPYLEKLKFLDKVLKENNIQKALSKLSYRYLSLPWKMFFMLAKNNLTVPLYVMIHIVNRIVSR